MTPEEQAGRLVCDHGVTMPYGYKHEDPAGAARLIAAAIREAVAAERERCAAIAERWASARDIGDVEYAGSWACGNVADEIRKGEAGSPGSPPGR